jgi:3-oxoacyl-[acyl-carrier-protein] synthase II
VISAVWPHDAQGAAASMRYALADAGVSEEEIDYVNAHGTGTRDNDATEAMVIHEVFDSCPEIPPVSSTKRLTGHTFGAAGAIEAVICLLAIQHGVLPPNAGSRDPDPQCNLPLVRAAISKPLQIALSCNLAFGGNNTALVFARTVPEMSVMETRL